MEDWKNMTREEFERDYAQGFTNGGVFWPWCQLTWKEKIVRVVIIIPLGCIASVAGFIGILAGIAMLIDGIARHSSDLDGCRQHAATPYEYHQCR